ncbi:hypothetical protein Q5P01_002870 [Channa striata]|uniref:Ig-like domain-containing protein n=1 Tax=Channa striata TaxID=64152 RepID=A0AA88NR81_CHASR|nr:hypothetical protein Q5P01_002870 [Channa striata]
MSMSWIWPFVFFNIVASSELKCPHTTVEAKADEAVILPCFTVPPHDLRLMTVEWVVNGTHDVHVFLKGEDHKLQIDKYKGRTSLYLDDLASGNCSLRLDRVDLSDNGTYSCSVRSRVGKVLGTCSFNLYVTKSGLKTIPVQRILNPEPTVSPEVGVNKGLKIGAGLGVGLIAVVIVGALYMKFAKKTPENLRMEEEQTEMI